jgi:hypothetical protein
MKNGGHVNSSITMGAASDTVTGANGDTVTTGAGSDVIDLGAAHTAAEFLAPGSGTDSGANDTVVHFNQSLGDRIIETGTAETNSIASASSSGGNTTITLADGSNVTLIGVSSISSNFFS